MNRHQTLLLVSICATTRRELSAESVTAGYNNFYEFGFSKDIVASAATAASYLSKDSWWGLTIIHFQAQPEPFLTQNTPYTPPSAPNTL